MVWISARGINARPAAFRSSRSDEDKSRNWPLIRSPFFSSTLMSGAISKAATFSQRPGITSACAGMEINPARIKETIWIRYDFMVEDFISALPYALVSCPPWSVPTESRRDASTNVNSAREEAHRGRDGAGRLDIWPTFEGSEKHLILRLTDVLLMIFSLLGVSGGFVADILGEIVNRRS